MCGTKLRTSSRLLVPFLVLFCLQSFSFCYAEVILTDEETEILMNEIQESRKDLTVLQEQLQSVKNDYTEQKKSYEMQLNEAENKEKKLKTTATITSTSSAIFLVLMLVFIII